jgi:hypothetical protein
MNKLRNRAKSSGRIFAPLIFKLALRLEQASWSDVSKSASEAVFVVRSAQRLFKLDAVSFGLDTWLEFEAAGGSVTRDEYGGTVNGSTPPESLPAANSFLQSEAIAHSIEVIRRFSDETSAVPLAGLTFGSTLIRRLCGSVRAAQIAADIKEDRLQSADNDLLEYAREIILSLATAYLEAGAAGLLLLHEENDSDLTELPLFASIFNLTAYYDVPAVLLCRNSVSRAGTSLLERYCAESYLTPTDAGAGITALPVDGADVPIVPSGWLGMSRWEIEPTVDPSMIHKLRREMLG